MSDIETILQNSILYVAGMEGLTRFSKAGHGRNTGDIVSMDGSLDLSKLMNMLLDVFPEDQASSIMDSVLAKYVETANEIRAKEIEQEQARVHSIVETAMAHPDLKPQNAGALPQAPAVEEGTYEENLARYLETETSDVKDLINEAKRIRAMMGKSAPPHVPVMPAIQSPGKHVTQAPEPMPVQEHVSAAKPVAITDQASLDEEIKAFVGRSKQSSSIDIMDFIRYLKEKGYHFQENKVLEIIYTRLEERKNRERTWLMADIQSYLERNPWPGNDDVSAYIEQKKNEGIIYDGAEIRRMILVEMMRKN